MRLDPAPCVVATQAERHYGLERVGAHPTFFQQSKGSPEGFTDVI